MKNVKAVIGIVLIFALGAVVGGLIIQMVYEERMEAIVSGESQGREAVLINRMSKRLDLDKKQQEQVHVILHDLMTDIRKQTRPQIMTALEKSRGRIKQILRPDQVTKYEKIIAEKQGQ